MSYDPKIAERTFRSALKRHDPEAMKDQAHDVFDAVAKGAKAAGVIVTPASHAGHNEWTFRLSHDQPTADGVLTGYDNDGIWIRLIGNNPKQTVHRPGLELDYETGTLRSTETDTDRTPTPGERQHRKDLVVAVAQAISDLLTPKKSG